MGGGGRWEVGESEERGSGEERQQGRLLGAPAMKTEQWMTRGSHLEGGREEEFQRQSSD